MILLLLSQIPSGKHTKKIENHEFYWKKKSLFFWPCSLAMLNCQRVVIMRCTILVGAALGLRYGWLVLAGTWLDDFSIQLGISSSQLTFIFFRRVVSPPDGDFLEEDTMVQPGTPSIARTSKPALQGPGKMASKYWERLKAMEIPWNSMEDSVIADDQNLSKWWFTNWPIETSDFP